VTICELKTSNKTGRGAASQLEKQSEYIIRKFGIAPTKVSLQKKSDNSVNVRKIPLDVGGISALLH
jgi:hypothetical protein